MYWVRPLATPDKDNTGWTASGVGKPRQPTQRIRPEVLDAAAQVTPQDIERAKTAARLYGTALFNAMLDAEAPARKLGRSQ